MSLLRVKRTWAGAVQTSAFDPKRTFAFRRRRVGPWSNSPSIWRLVTLHGPISTLREESMGAGRLSFTAASTRLLWGVTSLVFACIALAVTAGAEPLPRSVLFLDHNGPSEPFGQGMSAAFHTTMSADSREHVAIYAETLDLIRSSSSRYKEILTTYLREKYRDIPIGVIVAPGTAALAFMLPARAEIWPEVPAIFVANPAAAAEAKNIPGVTGMVRRQPLQASANTAQALIPSLKSIAVVGDVPRQDYQRARFKEQIAALTGVGNHRPHRSKDGGAARAGRRVVKPHGHIFHHADIRWRHAGLCIARCARGHFQGRQPSDHRRLGNPCRLRERGRLGR